MKIGISVSAILAGCLFIIAICGCAGAPELKETRDIRLNKASLARDVTSRQTDSIPLEEASVFSPEDPQALMWVKLDDVAGRHTLRWEWYAPDGKLYLSTDDYKINKDGKYRPYNTSWHKMAIKGERAASLQGKWQVKVFLDERPIARSEFEIKKSFSLKDIGLANKVKPDRHKWAVVIGIERYRKSAPVQFAESDARTMRDYLTNYLGVPEENTITIINDMATKAELEVMIKDRLRGLMREGDTLYLYYAGHGIPADETPYLLPYDGDPDSPAITAYSIDALYKDLDLLPAKNIFVFLDTCFSGRTGREEKETMLLAGARPGILKVKDPLLLSKKIVAMSAAKSNQLSNYYKEEGHGLFTYYLLKGLLGDADSNGDRKIQLKELTGYVEEEVGVASRRLFGLSRQQNPVSMPKPLSDKEDAVIAEVQR